MKNEWVPINQVSIKGTLLLTEYTVQFIILFIQVLYVISLLKCARILQNAEIARFILMYRQIFESVWNDTVKVSGKNFIWSHPERCWQDAPYRINSETSVFLNPISQYLSIYRVRQEKLKSVLANWSLHWFGISLPQGLVIVTQYISIRNIVLQCPNFQIP